MRGAPLGKALIPLGLLCATLAWPPEIRLLWNVSASAPVGLYRVEPRMSPRRGEMVALRLPAGWRDLAARRHYLPANVPLLKRVAGTAGDQICATGEQVFVNGSPVARRLAEDREGRPLPWWQGCEVLRANEYFLLMSNHPASFDGRYFGVTRSGVIGRARPIWVG